MTKIKKNKSRILIGLDKTIEICWGKEGVGFGVFTFYQKGKNLYIGNEYMNKEFIKEVLCAMVDNSILKEI